MIIYLLQASICLLLFYTVYIFMFGPHTQYLINRGYLLITLLISIIIPALNFETSNEVISTTTTVISSTLQSTIAKDQTSYSLSSVIQTIYVIGVGISMIFFFTKLIKLYRIIQTGKHSTIDGYQIIHTDQDIGVCSFTKYIIVAKGHTPNSFEFAHEKFHIDQYHSTDILIAWLYRSIFWFNPISYLYLQRLTEVHEFLADQGAIRKLGKSDYQNHILQVLGQKIRPQLVHNFNSIIKKRLTMMNSNSKPKLMSYISIIVVSALLFCQYSCKSKTVQMSSQQESSYSPWGVQVHDLNDPRRNWITETVMDTIITFDAETMKETFTIKKTEYQYTIDTIFVFDAETFDETISIVKTYRGAPPGLLGI